VTLTKLHEATASAAPPRLFERVRLVTMQPSGYAHSDVFAELVEGLAAAFAALGSQVDAVTNGPLLKDGINLVFGAHLLAPDASLPANCVVVNLEQLRNGIFAQPHYLDLLRHHLVLDYSPRNIARLREATGNPNIHRLPIGHMPSLGRIAGALQQDIDVLFYGSLNERRSAIIDALDKAGLRVLTLPLGAYGAERDAAIARAKIVLNMHYYEDKIHEIVRTSYLLSNRKAVVSECEPDTEIDDDVREAIVAVPYARLVETCVALARDDARRRAVESRGFEIFSQRNQADMLAQTLLQCSTPLPGRINLGSGKAYDPDRLNIDIDPKWCPDLLADLTEPFDSGRILYSCRFGLVRLDPGRFDEISAIDVLEHVPALVRMMTRCLELLRIGGAMRIVVPYDLSWGAWQDPTHIRAFNERSWLYYTTWHWYLGWIEARFDLAEMKMKLSPVGEALRKRGVADEELFRTPRAVDEMQVVLVKRACTDAERQQAHAFLGTGRNAGAANDRALS
jgi:hypothetical protein